ncbi:tetratricopeptide repeat protein [archaeon]|nr:MAG: tetratricopeptide repeat protein [archaeon]
MNFQLKSKGRASGIKKSSVFGDLEDEEPEQLKESTKQECSQGGDKDKSDILREQGCGLAEDGQFAEAIDLWQRALYITPNDHRLHELKAQGYLALDQVNEALLSAERAVELQPSWVEGLQCLARCQREVGEVELSLQMYRKAQALAPTNEELCNEVMDVENLVNQLEMRRKAHFDRLNNSKTDDEAEVHRCFYHLSARAPPIKPETSDSPS